MIFGWIKAHKKILMILSFLFLLTLALAYRWRKADQNAFSEPLKRGSIIESVYGIGTVNATHHYEFKPGVSMTLRKLYVKEGDEVKDGQVLLDLDQTKLRAPFTGTITSLPFKEGENVFPQAVVYRLTSLKERYILVAVEQRAALRVKKGQKARISFESLRNQFFEGFVESVYSNQNNFFVRISAQNLPGEILPEMTADVAIGIAEHPNALLIPVKALEGSFVNFKRGNEKLRKVSVKIGVVDGEWAQLLSNDLQEGDLLSLPKVKP